MGADIDFDNESVVNELINWGRWYYDTTHIAGFRLDAVKHIKAAFYDKWISAMRQYTGKPLFTVGEYWHRQTGALENYLAETNGQISLFDVPLHFKFYYASTDANNFDLRTIFDDTLTKENSTHSVTFVDNHDTQPEQALCSTIEQWFKPHAYAMILLREAGYPCVFYGDYYGIEHNNIAPMKEWLNVLIKLRYDYAYGLQRDFFTDAHCIGWTREGDETHSNSSIAVLLSTGADSSINMNMGIRNANTLYTCVFGEGDDVVTDADGNAEFSVKQGSVSCYIIKD